MIKLTDLEGFYERKMKIIYTEQCGAFWMKYSEWMVVHENYCIKEIVWFMNDKFHISYFVEVF